MSTDMTGHESSRPTAKAGKKRPKRSVKQKKPVIVNKFGIDHFTPHDLRRTAATHMSKQGQTNEVIDAILNHTKKGSAVIATYNQNPYDNEKQIALDAWEQELIRITGIAA